jgi:hypothetical protein
MQQVIAEHIEPGSGAIRAARTFKATAVECLLEGNEIVTGVVKAQTEDGEVLLLVSSDERHFQCVRVYDSGGNLIESLQCREGTVVYADEQAVRNAASNQFKKP